MRTFTTSLILLLPLLAMTEGGAMYQRLVNLPLWIADMTMMKHFHHVGRYFLLFTPPLLIIWGIMVYASRNYTGQWRMLLFANHVFYFLIILTTAVYLIPVLGRYVGNAEATLGDVDLARMRTWAIVSMIRQILGFIVVLIYAFVLASVGMAPKPQ